MEPTEIKANLNRPVRYKNSKSNVDTDYILTGAIFRRNSKGFYYQAELQDIKNKGSIVICKLEDIEAAERSNLDERTQQVP